MPGLPSNRRIRPLLQMLGAGGPSRWIALLILLGLGVLVLVQPGSVPPPQAPLAPRQPSANSSAERAETAGRSTSTATPSAESASYERMVQGPRGVLRSPFGLVYTRGSEHGHRIQHVLAHGDDEPERPGQHGVFSVGSDAGVLMVVDEAYTQAQRGGPGVQRREQGERTVWTVDLGRIVGYVGGQVGNRRGRPPARHVRLVLEDGNRVITAYPVIP